MIPHADAQHVAQLYADFYALEWYLTAGVNELYGAEPVNRLASVSVAALLDEKPLQAVEQSVNANPKMPAYAVQTPPSAAVEQARVLADTATSVEMLQTSLRQFDGCGLKRTALHTIVGDGKAIQPRILFISDAPRDAEEREGVTFAGDIEKIMQQCCKGLGVAWDECFRMPSVFWRPPGNRMVSKDEMDICAPFVEKFIALLKPVQIVLLGATPVQMLLQVDSAMSRIHGKHYAYSNRYSEGEVFKTLVSYHPYMLLGDGGKKKQFWQDMLGIVVSI